MDEMPPEIPELTGEDIELAVIDETLEASLEETRQKMITNGHLQVLKQRLSQQMLVELAQGIEVDLRPLTKIGTRGIADLAVMKLGLDILTNRVQAKTARDAAEAMKILTELNSDSAGELINKASSGRTTVSATERTVVFREVTAKLAEIRGEQEPPEPVIDVESSE